MYTVRLFVRFKSNVNGGGVTSVGVNQIRKTDEPNAEPIQSPALSPTTFF